MKYCVIELQNGIGMASPVYDTRESAEAAYHTVMAAAAVSTITKHGALLLDENGARILPAPGNSVLAYRAPEPEPEPVDSEA